MKMDPLIPLAPRVFDLFDNNRDGTVDMREILCGLSSLRNSRGDDALRLCFQVHGCPRKPCTAESWQVASSMSEHDIFGRKKKEKCLIMDT
jgi:calcium-dependent protein kinase